MNVVRQNPYLLKQNIWRLIFISDSFLNSKSIFELTGLIYSNKEISLNFNIVIKEYLRVGFNKSYVKE